MQSPREPTDESRPTGALPKGLDEAERKKQFVAAWAYACEHVPNEGFFEELLSAAFEAGAVWRAASQGSECVKCGQGREVHPLDGTFDCRINEVPGCVHHSFVEHAEDA